MSDWAVTRSAKGRPPLQARSLDHPVVVFVVVVSTPRFHMAEAMTNCHSSGHRFGVARTDATVFRPFVYSSLAYTPLTGVGQNCVSVPRLGSEIGTEKRLDDYLAIPTPKPSLKLGPSAHYLAIVPSHPLVYTRWPTMPGWRVGGIVAVLALMSGICPGGI
ncbi:unnamed protein product [Schistocephalus solidus]|uniref:Transposase n=1 Tax=Schistocephalus solidus TaxID=70667 RepID=A0A183TH15_SCHSO|nr:unnamed protein product [Schistocephalus solidus]